MPGPVRAGAAPSTAFCCGLTQVNSMLGVCQLATVLLAGMQDGPDVASCMAPAFGMLRRLLALPPLVQTRALPCIRCMLSCQA